MRVRHKAMSITMSNTTYPTSNSLAWKQADADVHVATRDGEFAGFVEFDGVTHRVRDNHGADLGAFLTLDAAFLALEGVHTPTRQGGSLPRFLPRAWRRRSRRARA